MAPSAKISSDYGCYLALLLILALCLCGSLAWFAFDQKRIAEIFLILQTLIGLSSSHNSQQSLICFWRQTRIASQLSLIALISIGLLSATLAPVPGQSIIEIITLFSLLLLAQLIAPVWIRYPFALKLATGAIILSIAIQEIEFLTHCLAFLIIADGFSPNSFFLGFDNIRFFNQYQLWLLPPLTALLLFNDPLLNSKLVKSMLWCLVIISWLMFFTSDGRGAVVAITSSLLACHLIFRREAAAFLKLTLSVVFGGFVLSQILFHGIPYLLDREGLEGFSHVRLDSSGRVTYLWPKAINFIVENPILGIGPMHYAWYENSLAAHPHNSVLQWGAEWGLPSLALVLTLIYRGIRSWLIRFNQYTVKHQSINVRLAVIALTFSLSSSIVYSLFCGVIVMPMSHFAGTLIISLMLAVYQKGSLSTMSETIRLNWLFCIFFSVTAIIYFYLLVPDIVPRVFNSNFLPDNRLDVVGPRFWFIGDISK